jgi:hypothetical protein
MTQNSGVVDCDRDGIAVRDNQTARICDDDKIIPYDRENALVTMCFTLYR